MGAFVSDGTTLYVVSEETDGDGATGIVGIAKDTREVATVTTLENQHDLTLYGDSLLTFSDEGFVLTPTTGGASTTFLLDSGYGAELAVDPPRIAALVRDGAKSRKLILFDELGAQPRELPVTWTKEKPYQFVIAGDYAYLLRHELRRISLVTGLEETWVEDTEEWRYLVGTSDGGLYFAVRVGNGSQSWIQYLPPNVSEPVTVLTVDQSSVSQILSLGTDLYVRTADGVLHANTSTWNVDWPFENFRGQVGMFADDRCIFLHSGSNIVREPR
jgi:hypothetical protein